MNPGGGNFRGMRTFSRDNSVLEQKLAPATRRRILQFAKPYAWPLAIFLVLVILDAAVGIGNPLIYREIVNKGILPGNQGLIIRFALLAASLSIADAGLTFGQRYLASKIGQDMLYEMRAKVFAHIQSMSLAFFTRTRTGALVSRLNSDVQGIQSAFTDILSTVIGNFITVALTLITMFILSWQLTLAALVLLPVFIIPARRFGQRIQALTRESYDVSADMNTLMTERFNVAGAQLAKVFGRPEDEENRFRQQAGRVRDIGVIISTYTRIFFITLGLIASLAVSFTYGWGGILAVRHTLDVGTLVALAVYLTRLYGPLTSLSNVQVDVMTTLVSFDRVFEILDLKPLVSEKADAVAIPAGPAEIAFNHVSFTYPTAKEVSLASLESVAVLSESPEKEVLHDLDFTIRPGTMTALVGPSGAGKTTITQLAARFYDPKEGSIAINGADLRDTTFDSIRTAIGMVMQESHMFHDTIRANLLYAKPDATEDELRAALEAAQILPLIDSLGQGLDTVIGDRGHRLSGGEKQRVAIARVLLKAPPFIVLDEATAHLDSESERAIQAAFHVALEGRTSLVIAHRLSTILNADQILVLEKGRIVERGKHAELVKNGGLYADLYRKQFSGQAD